MAGRISPRQLAYELPQRRRLAGVGSHDLVRTAGDGLRVDEGQLKLHQVAVTEAGVGGS
jgi:hypothetical protein